ncbi:MAG TPA: CPBP family intramembrane metalloprotease, partial [Planctomycetaceae bacterium]|nr:CPBP family intramembrane metalloprotease [Planctomycetaceae bacterium]
MTPMAASLIVIAVFLASCALWVRLLVAWRRSGDLLRSSLGASLSPGRGAVVFVWGWVGYQFALSLLLPERTAEPSLNLVISSCLMNALVLALLVTMLRFQASVPPELFGASAGAFRRQVLIGVGGFIAAMAPVDLVLWSTIPLRRGQPPHVLLRLLQSHPDFLTIAAVVLAAVILAPAVEELMFRVVMQSWLRQQVGPPRALLLTALVFVGMHGPRDAVALIPLALVLGYVFERTGSFWAVAVTHSLFNSY